MSTKYRSDEQQLDFLQRRIERLEKTLERLESLGMTSFSSAGQSKSFRSQEEIRQELEVATKEYEIINSRIQGIENNYPIKEAIVCDRKHF
jgi:hypothetical protein